jgi:hypothetical protein
VIKGNDEPCGNYALKGKTCCYSHRKLENEPYFDEKPKNNQDQTERAVLVNEAIKRLESDDRCVSICRNGKRCSRFYNISRDDGNRWCGQHWIKVMNKRCDDITEILSELNKPQKDSDSESDSESNDPTYYARIKKRS